MTWASRMRYRFFDLETAGDRKFSTHKIVMRMKNKTILSYSLIKLLRFHNLSVGDF